MSELVSYRGFGTSYFGYRTDGNHGNHGNQCQ